MRNIKITIEYDGTNYSGWQTQKNGPSIQEELEKALFALTGENSTVHGSGRTDAGVHARGQIASFTTKSRIPIGKYAYAINTQLPKDIVVKGAQEVDPNFHARFSAKGKEYSYLLLNSPFSSPLLRNYCWHVNYCEKLDMERFKKAASYMVGEHDFYSFMAAGSKVKDTVRRVESINVETLGEQVRIAYRGNGFLYNMVRIMTGTLLYAGIGRIDPEEIPDIIKSKDRERAGITAPPNGLCLEKVFYNE